MKFSLKSRFAKLSLSLLVTMFIVEITGRLSSTNGSLVACTSWPLCYPVGFFGWLQLIHRITVGFAVISVLFLLQQSWSKYRDSSTLLALSTLVTILFFSNVFTGAINIMRGQMAYITVLHSLTAIGLWILLFGLVIAAGYLANSELVEFPPINVRERAWDLLMLTKPVIVSLLLVTTLGGMIAGARSIPSVGLIFWTLLGGALAAGGASALNQYIDRDLDKNMQRTSNRPLSSGRMLPAEGLAFGLALSVISFYILAGFVNLLTALLGLAGIVYYVWLYSILLKKATVQNIVIGGGAGAIPPLVGWAAATGNLSTAAWFMFAIIFLWTPPHFWALSIVRKKDYERAGVPMLPVVKGETETRRQIWLYTLLLVGVSVMMPILHLAGTIFLISSVALGLWILSTAWKVYKGEGNKSAWKMYRYTSMYLLFIFLFLVIDALI
jgi:protoheme IX farnesyltransferase